MSQSKPITYTLTLSADDASGNPIKIMCNVFGFMDEDDVDETALVTMAEGSATETARCLFAALEGRPYTWRNDPVEPSDG